MGLYRVTRRFGQTSELTEGYGGIEDSPSYQRPVLIRRLRPGWGDDGLLASRVQHRFEAFTRVSLPGAPRYVEVGRAHDTLWSIQLLQEGEPLRQLLAALRGQPLSAEEAVNLALPVAGTLSTLHEAGLVHGDVSPSSVLVTPAGGAALLDGVLALVAEPSALRPVPRTELQALSPEQLDGRSEASADVFRFGLMLYEALSGEPLFAGDSAAEVEAAARQYQAMPASAAARLPPRLGGLLAWMLAANPEDRPGAREVENALELAAAQAGYQLSRAPVVEVMARAFPGADFQAQLRLSTGKPLELLPLARPAPSPRQSDRIAAPAPSGAAVLGKMAPRRLSATELAETKARDEADERAREEALAMELLARANNPRLERVGVLLQERGVLSPVDFEAAARHAETRKTSLADALMFLGLAEEDEVLALTAEETGLPFLDSARVEVLQVPREVSHLLAEDTARTAGLLPVEEGPSGLKVLVRQAPTPQLVEEARVLTRAQVVHLVRVGPRAFENLLQRLFSEVEGSDVESWLERGPGAPSVPAKPPSVPPVQPGVRGPQGLEPSASPAASGGRGRAEPLHPSPPTRPGASDRQLLLTPPVMTLVEALLTLHGERGKEGRALLGVVTRAALHLGLSAEEVAALRFAAAVVVVSNLAELRAAWQTPTVHGLMPLVGNGFTEVEPLLAPLLTGRGDTDVPAAGLLLVVLTVAAQSGTPVPPPRSAAAVLRGLQLDVPPGVVEAVAGALGVLE